MTSATWSNEKIINFIDAVRLRVCLWDNKCPNYKNRVLKKDAWVEIGTEFDIPFDEAAKKFKNLRTYFNNELKKLEKKQKSGSGASPESTWFAFKTMLFLKGVEEADAGIDTESRLDEQAETSDDDTITSVPPLPPALPAATQGAKKKKTLVDTQYDTACDVMEKVKEKLSKKTLAFGDHVNEKLLSYSEYVRNQVQYKISTILFEADMGYYNKQHSPLIDRSYGRSSHSSGGTYAPYSVFRRDSNSLNELNYDSNNLHIPSGVQYSPISTAAASPDIAHESSSHPRVVVNQSKFDSNNLHIPSGVQYSPISTAAASPDISHDSSSHPRVVVNQSIFDSNNLHIPPEVQYSPLCTAAASPDISKRAITDPSRAEHNDENIMLIRTITNTSDNTAKIQYITNM